jgi:hypothetical protein
MSGEDKQITIDLEPPEFYIHSSTDDHHSRLRLSGSLDVRSANQPDADPDFSFDDIAIEILLSLALKEETNVSPKIGLVYEGVPDSEKIVVVDGDPDGLSSILLNSQLSIDDIDALFAMPEIASTLDEVSIDVVSPITEALSPIYFPQEVEDNEPPPPPPPAPEDWSVSLHLMMAMIEGYMNAIGVFVALPGDDSNPGEPHSVLPSLTGLGFVYSRDFLDFVLTKGAKDKEGSKMDGAKIKRLSMSMLDDGIQVDGKAEKEGAEIKFSGPVIPRLARGTTYIAMDSSKVKVDVDLPWYADLLIFMTPILFFIPGINFLAVSKTVEILHDVDEAPAVVREGLGTALGAQLAKLTEGLTIKTSVGEVTLDGTPDHSLVVNGHFLLFAQIFVSPITDTIVHGIYHRYSRRFTFFRLESGRQFRATELARLVNIGKIITPGFHDVEGRYMRANPDNETGNNLLEMFNPYA